MTFKSLFFSLFLFSLAFGLPAAAKIGDWDQTLNSGATQGQIYTTTPSDQSAASSIANYVGKVLFIIPFLGLIFIIRLVWAGYLWLTAGGKADQVAEAQRTISHAVIGIVILTALYIITYFILAKLSTISGYQGF